ncbi:hypothetical protein F5B17DRAFT_436983 [Nemania serpens]|nr:hypothetical protein F5B17DRAFT_436983 [Nemania serpens]
MTTTINLKAPAEWEAWLANIMQSARSLSIEDYVDPDAEKPPTPPRCPATIPMPCDYQDGALRASDLSDEAQKKWTIDQKEYHLLFEVTRQHQAKIAEINKLITQTVDPIYQPFINDIIDPRERVLALRRQLAPSVAVIRREIYTAWGKIRDPARNIKPEAWVQDFEMLYKRCLKHKINISDKYNTLLDMLTAISSWNEPFASHYRRTITDQFGETNGEAKMINPLDLAHRFREELELQRSTRPRNINTGAFPTLQGQPKSDRTTESNRSNQKRRNPPQCAK